MKQKTIDMENLKNQSFRTEFKKRNYSQIEFLRIPRTNAERVFFLKLNNILKDLNLTVKITYSRMYSNQYVSKMKRFREIENPFVYHVNFNEINHTTTLSNSFDEPENEAGLNIKNNVVWNVFGNHYAGNRLNEQLNDLQQMKVAYLRLSRENYMKLKRIEELENHISDTLPLKSKNKFARVNEFLRAGKRKFK